ncbi:MAG: TAXI family TRAP transporter solute-binding subunit [Betaproteobacteria bacterium]|nr:TAXI family TRAP transporter solute-binding subunit [Betaproteobacteria bacterium]
MKSHTMKFLAGFACASLFAATAAAQTVSIITTPVGSFSNSAGGAMAKVLIEKAKLRAVVQAQASTGFEETASGTADFNVSNSFDATFFATGTGDYAGRDASKNLRNVGALIPYRVAMHVRADSPYKRLADLKGQRVSSDFNAQKTIGRIIEAHLANAGLSYNDVVKVPTPNVVRQSQDFMANKTDVMFFALGSAAVKQAHASVGGVRVLEIDSAPDAFKRVQDLLPGAYVLRVSPHPSIEGLSQPTNLVGFDMVMVARAELAEDVVYKVVKALYENKADLQATFRPFALFDPKTMAKPLQSVPYHPGALRFFKEAGLLP